MNTSTRLVIQRMPAKKCNHSLGRKTLAKVFDYDKWKILFIIDSEGKGDNAIYDVIDHIRDEFLDNIRVVVIDPRHEKWLCIGIGGSHAKCSSDPENEIMRILRGQRGLRVKSYSKDFLSRHANKININVLLREKDFREYLNAIKWLISDP